MDQEFFRKLEERGLPILAGAALAVGLSFALWIAILVGGWQVFG
ncbi:MAG: hypothetical protein KatS3mg076_2038 [Candidatus Binatia bacterium]|nr:MAG: hypothetical protein KatS3mg076_2038 [Candidatus Binatia bacterium]